MNSFLLQTSNETEPSFAEELAKRLGTVRQAQNPVVDEASESSINRFKSICIKQSLWQINKIKIMNIYTVWQ